MTDSYTVGCDIGGTFTDIAVINDQGTLWTAKADTTPGSLADGVVAAVTLVADQMQVDVETLLEQTERFVNGTTVVTNNLLELSGAKTGLLTTQGFGDTLRIARIPAGDERDQHDQRNVPDIVDRSAIREIPERIDYSGETVVELDETALRDATVDLVENEGVETIAVCFLWSVENGAHETRAREIIHDEYPDRYVTLSHEVYAGIKEYERMVTAVANSYTAPDVAEYFDQLETELSDMGLDPAAISVMQGSGGSTTVDQATAEPVRLLNSGPTGGVIASQALGDQLDEPNIIAADMGGTSFECSIIENGEYSMSERTEIRRQIPTALTTVDMNTIGAGGGSLVDIDKRGIPQVGPDSAGARPGPACYDRGGTDATLTDAALVLGLISPDSVESGSVVLDADAASAALERDVAGPMGMSVEAAAAAVYNIAVESMSNAIRGVTIEVGRDPSKFTMMAYGGALPMFAADACSRLGISRAVVPEMGPVFSAYGLMQTDDVRIRNRSVFWNPGDPVETVNEALAAMADEVRSDLRAAGFDEADISVEREAKFKFQGQLYDYPISLPDEPLTEADLEAIRDEFPETYEQEYGSGTAWNAPVVIRGARVTGRGRTASQHTTGEEAGSDEALTPTATRTVFLPNERRESTVPVYNGGAIHPGDTVSGAALVDTGHTTVFVPASHAVSADRRGTLSLTETDAQTDATATGTTPEQES